VPVRVLGAAGIAFTVAVIATLPLEQPVVAFFDNT
jgi:hypothetical protein